MTAHIACARTAALDVRASCEATIPRSIETVFDFVTGEDVLPKVLTGYGFLPAVVSTSDLSGPWDRAGSHRIVHLVDGGTVHEEITAFERPSYFAYRVSNPSFALRHLIEEAHGQFWFAPIANETRLTWTYTFQARNHLAKLPLALLVKTQWKGYMDVCFSNIAKHLSKA